MNRLGEIYRELEEIRDREAIRLFRLSRKAAEHGCSDKLCVLLRAEGWMVQKMQPEQLLYPFNEWYYAFRFGGDQV